MSIEEICALNVPCSENSVLYLWATTPKLQEALRVMSAWGFSYKTSAVWDKQILGMGYWFRGQHELLLVGVRGKFSPPEQSTRLSSVFSIRRERHSKKPAHIRNCIKEWFPNAKRLELFAREQSEGWDVWGNQVVSKKEVEEALKQCTTSEGSH
jgi:N6-adenosine-specific RNA methylase IME4